MIDDASKINETAWNYRAARVLEVVNKIDLFTALSTSPLNLQQICDKCRTKPEMTEKLLIACAAMGLIERNHELYSNTQPAQSCLVRGRDLYQGDIIAHADTVRQFFWDRLEEELCLEVPIEDEATKHRHFIMGMHNMTMGERGRIFTENIDLQGRSRLLDVGGGPGTYSILACRKYPQLNAVVFDLPDTISIAREVVTKEAMQDRIEFCEGDWEKGTFGNGFDAVLFSNVMHGEHSMAQMKLRKSRNAMVDGGLLVIQEFLLNNEKTGPLTSALFNLMVGAYSQKELLSLVTESGFVDAKVVAADDQLGAAWITANKPI